MRNRQAVLTRQDPRNLEDALRIRGDVTLGMRLVRSERDRRAHHRTLPRVGYGAAHDSVVALAEGRRRRAKQKKKNGFPT